MSDRKIVHENPDGTIAVTTLARNSLHYNKDETIWLEAVAQRLIEAGAVHKDAVRLDNCHIDDLPDRARRHAWRRKPRTKTIHDDVRIPDLEFEPSLEDRVKSLEDRNGSTA